MHSPNDRRLLEQWLQHLIRRPTEAGHRHVDTRTFALETNYIMIGPSLLHRNMEARRSPTVCYIVPRFEVTLKYCPIISPEVRHDENLWIFDIYEGKSRFLKTWCTRTCPRR